MALGKMSGYVLIAICLYAIMVDALNFDRVDTMVMDNTSENDLKKMMELDKAMASLENLKQLFGARNENGGCSCTGLTCKCCQRIKVRQIHLDAQCCISLTFRSQAGTVIVALTIDGHTIFKQEFPVSKPISPCIKFKVAKVCIEFHDFHVDSKAFTGCTRVTFSILGKKVGHFELGCFHINFLLDSSSSSSSMPFLPPGEASVVEPAAIIENAQGILYMQKDIFGESDKDIGDEDNKI